MQTMKTDQRVGMRADLNLRWAHDRWYVFSCYCIDTYHQNQVNDYVVIAQERVVHGNNI